MTEEANRRPIATRGAAWAQGLSRSLNCAGVTPNQVSVASVAFALVGAALFFVAGGLSPALSAACFVGVSVCIQGRLVCNLIDGMIAIEGGKKTTAGALFNEFPDRIADSLFFVFAGYAAAGGALSVALGWAAALVAVLTAYIRVFGMAEGLEADFCGPMAKQHRMAVLTVACLCSAGEVAFGYPPRVITWALGIIVAGGIITCVRRARRIVDALNSRWM